MGNKYVSGFRNVSAQSEGSTRAHIFLQVSISRTSVDHLADLSFETLHVAPKDATLAK
jgi:hypothetical protein